MRNTSGGNTTPTPFENTRAARLRNTSSAPGPRRWGTDSTPSSIDDSSAEAALFANASAGGINFDQYESVPVSVSGPDGKEPPAAVEDFSCLPAWLGHNVARCKYSAPTPIQRHTLAAGIGGFDLMACAQTGSGKTAAFLLPTLSRLSENTTEREDADQPSWGSGMRGRTATPACIILSPTRELAEQIYNDAKKFSFRSKFRCAAVFGGEGTMGQQLRELERGVDILVACPGRLHDLIDRGHVQCGSVTTLILDEADRMLDMGFEPQIRAIVQRTSMPTSADGRQTLMFSATFPRAIQSLACDFLCKERCVRLEVGTVGTNDNITQHFRCIGEEEKLDALMDLLQCPPGTPGDDEPGGLTVIFTGTKRVADMLEYTLSHEGLHAVSIHGDKSQPERKAALSEFKAGRAKILVATDVAARGLDVKAVSHVINFDFPGGGDVDSYVHRIGRTGRAGRTGHATSLVTARDSRMAAAIVVMLEDAGLDVPPELQRIAARNQSAPPARKKDKEKAGVASDWQWASNASSSGGGAATVKLTMAEYEAQQQRSLLSKLPVAPATAPPSTAEEARRGKGKKKGKNGGGDQNELISWEDAMGLGSGSVASDVLNVLAASPAVSVEIGIEGATLEEASTQPTPTGEENTPLHQAAAQKQLDADVVVKPHPAVLLLIETMSTAPNAIQCAGEIASQLAGVCATDEDEVAVLEFLDAHGEEWPQGAQNLMHIAKLWYDEDAVSEDGVLMWWGKHAKSASAMVEQMRPFVQWLEEAEEED